MSIYILTVVWVAFFGLISKYTDNKLSLLTDKGNVKHTFPASLFFAFIVFFLVFVSGNRYYVGTDFGAYYKFYEIFANQFLDALKSYDEPGFKFLCWIVIQTGGNGHNVILLASAVTLIIYLVTLYKNTDRQTTATLLFIFLGCWHVSFNAVRQCLAASFIFLGINAMRNKNFTKFLICIFIASLFHKTAIVMVVIYFLVNRKVSVKNISLLIIASIAILLSFDKVFEFTSFFMEDIHSDTLEYSTASVNVFRILVAAVPAVYVIILKWGKEYTDRETFATNLLIINAIFMFATSNSTYFARLGIYTAPFVAVSLPEMIRVLKGKTSVVVHGVMLTLYAVYWFYEVYNSSALNPFRFIWGNV